jgi:hypothetical protein
MFPKVDEETAIIFASVSLIVLERVSTWIVHTRPLRCTILKVRRSWKLGMTIDTK